MPRAWSAQIRPPSVVSHAAEVLERLAEAIRILDEEAPDGSATASDTSG